MVELERTIIAIILQAEMNNASNALFNECKEAGVTEDFFLNHGCASVWNFMQELDSAGNTIEEVSVMTKVTERGLDISDFMAISDYAKSELHFKQKLEELVEVYRRRQCSRIARHISEAIEDRQSTDEVLRQNTTKSKAISEMSKEDRTVENILDDTISDLFNPPDKSAFIPTGIDSIDRVLYGGGYGPSQLCVVAARPGCYKTAFSLNYARNACLLGKPTLLFNLEMGDTQLMKRMLSRHAQMPLRHFADGSASKNQVQALKKARSEINEWPIFIKDNIYNLAQILAVSRGMHRKHNLGTIVIDYCQLIKPMTRGLVREQVVAEISRETKLLAKDLNIPVILLAQLNRESEKDNREPIMSDLRESGALEADADSILMPWKTKRDKDEEVNYVRWALAKQREGQGHASGVFGVNPECSMLTNYNGTVLDK